MLRTNGQMFHIDFGFIFGRDPKPLPPPFRFTRAMADAMGGEDSDHYKRFQSYCCQAYNWLRKSANLILNMLSLMVDASIPDLSVHEDHVTVLKKVEEKFRLDLSGQLSTFPPTHVAVINISSCSRRNGRSLFSRINKRIVNRFGTEINGIGTSNCRCKEVTKRASPGKHFQGAVLHQDSIQYVILKTHFSILPAEMITIFFLFIQPRNVTP